MSFFFTASDFLPGERTGQVLVFAPRCCPSPVPPDPPFSFYLQSSPTFIERDGLLDFSRTLSLFSQVTTGGEVRHFLLTGSETVVMTGIFTFSLPLLPLAVLLLQAQHPL